MIHLIPSTPSTVRIIFHHSDILSTEARKEFVTALRTFLQEQIDALYAKYSTTYEETIQRSAQVMHGGLNQFLTTPLKSDNVEIARTLKEGLGKFVEHFIETKKDVQFTMEPSWILFEPKFEYALSPAIKKMVKRTKAFLKTHGVSVSTTTKQVFEISFSTSTTEHCLVLFHLIKKFQHDLSLPPTYTDVENVIFQIKKEGTQSSHVLSLPVDFVVHDEMDSLKNALSVVSEQFAIHSIGLYERNILSPFEKSYIFRLKCDLVHTDLNALVMAIAQSSASLKNNLLNNSPLLISQPVE